MLKHDRAYLRVDSEDSIMCMKRKCNMVSQLPEIAYVSIIRDTTKKNLS